MQKHNMFIWGNRAGREGQLVSYLKSVSIVCLSNHKNNEQMSGRNRAGGWTLDPHQNFKDQPPKEHRTYVWKRCVSNLHLMICVQSNDASATYICDTLKASLYQNPRSRVI